MILMRTCTTLLSLMCVVTTRIYGDNVSVASQTTRPSLLDMATHYEDVTPGGMSNVTPNNNTGTPENHGNGMPPVTPWMGGNTSAPDAGPSKDLWLLGLFPFRGSWAGGLGQLPAIQMGIQDVNLDPSMLPGYNLRLTVNDTQCDPGIGTNALYQQLYRPPTKLLVLGAGCSSVSQATGQASHLWNLVQLSYSSASPALSEKSLYKRFFRVFPPESSFNPAKFALLKHFGWRRVGTLHEAQEIFTLTTADFRVKAPLHDIQVLSAESFMTDPRQQVRNLKKQGVRIIVGNFYENKAQVIFCEAYKQQMYGPKYVWIITGFYSPQWWLKTPVEADSHDCTRAQLEKAIVGYFTADALPLSLSSHPGISGKTYEQFLHEYQKNTNYSTFTGHQEAPYGYDSVWAVAHMLNRSLQFMRSHGWTSNLEDFTYNDTAMGDLFLRIINSTAFQGVSGPVLFDERGDRQGLTQIEQLQRSAEVRVGVYDPSAPRSQRLTWQTDTPVIWQESGPPPDSVTERVLPRVISASLFILMTILAATGIVLSCLFFVFNIKYRHRKYIKMSSPNMNNIILAGAFSAFLGIIFGGVDSRLASQSVHLLMCKFYNWTLALGFSLAFGAMFSKTWRVHKIFTNKKIQRMVIRDSQLIAVVCVLVGLDVLVLTVWEVVDPLQIRAYNKTTQQIPDPANPDNQVLIPQIRLCESPHMWYFAGILYAIKGLLLVFGAFLAFETRKVTVPALNDSKFIGLSVYNVMVLCLIGVPVAWMLKEQMDAAYALISLFIFFATLLTICLVFVPKILHRNKEPHSGGTLWNKTLEGSTCTGGASNAGHTALVPTSLSNLGEQNNSLDRLKTENSNLRSTLEQCRRRIVEFEGTPQVNGMWLGHGLSAMEELLPSEPPSPLPDQSPQTAEEEA